MEVSMRDSYQNKTFIRRAAKCLSAFVLSSALISPGGALLFASSPAQPLPEVQTTIPPDQLDALVAPIALYPDNLLAQVLVATTYPLEIIQLYQWLQKNPELAKDQQKLNAAVAKQPWDPSIQSMASLPDVVKWLAEDVQWTADLGNAFLAQQKDVMDAVQRMRAKAKDKGTLTSNDKMKVETQVIESKQVIVIEPSNPEIVYVPSYDPVYVYGSIGYPYPPIYYPPYYYGSGAYWAAGAIGFGLGLAWGAAWGGWGWGCGWGGGDIDVDIDNNFNRNNNFNGGDRNNNFGDRGNRGDRGGRNQVNPLDRGGNRGQGNRGQGGRGSGGKWQHNPSHRGGAPYGDRGTANRFGGSSRGDSVANRQSGARNQIGRQGGNLASTRPANTGGLGNRGSAPGGGFSSRGNAPGVGNRMSGGGDRTGGSLNSANRGGSGFGNSGSVGNRSSGIGSSNRSSGIGSSNRSGGFNSGSSRGWGGSGTRMNSSRGSSSMGSSRGSFGGGSRGGGGGFSRGGGGGRGGGGRGGRR